MLAIIDKIYFYAALWTYDKPVDPTTFSASVSCYRTMLRLLYATRDQHRSVIASLPVLNLQRALTPRARVCFLGV